MNKEKQKNILIIGDWVVDENWIVAEHFSDISSNVGIAHFRSLSKSPDTQIFDLCGAGWVMKILSSYFSEKSQKDRNINLYGIGLWNNRDTKYLCTLFSSKKISNQTPGTLSSIKALDKGEGSFSGICFQKCSKKKCKHLICLNKDDKYNTNRVLRIYRQAGEGNPELLYRFDWESSKKNIKMGKVEDAVSRIKESVNEKIDIIIAVDLDKGGIQKNLINCLKENFPDGEWFIRTKSDSSKFKSVIPKTRLLLLGPNYVEKKFSNVNRWFYGHLPSLETITSMEELLCKENTECQKDRWLVTHHRDNRSMAIVITKESKYGLVVWDHPEPAAIRAGRTTYFFAALIHQIIEENDNSNEKKFAWALEKCQDQVASATKCMKESLEIKEENNVNNHKIIVLVPLSKEPKVKEREYEKPFQVTTIYLDKEKKHWEDSKKELGIIDSKSYKFGKFQIWRGFSAINDCIVLQDNKKKHFGKLLIATKQFLKDPDPKKSLGCLLLGSPGTGKSYVVTQLAKQLRLTLLFFNITHLSSIDELIDCFDEIASAQARASNNNNRFLIFFDEINAEIQGHSIWGNFLSPLLDGVYRRGGHLFTLKPSIWIFAGTEVPGVNENASDQSSEFDQNHSTDKGRRSEKASDFESRINGPIVFLDPENSTSDEKKKKMVRLENVYTAMLLARCKFLDFIFVEKDVLSFFYNLELKIGTRSLSYIIDSFRNVQYGRLEVKNLPVDFDIISRWCKWEPIEKIAEEYNDWRENSLEKSIKGELKLIRVYDEPSISPSTH
jgi:DNA replication protein DnaC